LSPYGVKIVSYLLIRYDLGIERGIFEMATFPTRLEMEKKFKKVFTSEQTASLVDTIDIVRQAEVERAADTRDLKRGLTELTQEVKNLAAAQQRTDERLAKFQQRTDERFAEMAAAQQSTDEQLKQLTAAQQSTDETLTQLSHTVQTLTETMQVGFAQLHQAIGGLGNTLGFNLEEFVAALLPPYIEKHGDITGLTLERRYFEVGNGQPAEIDLVSSGQRKGQPVLILAECRTSIGGGEMRRIARKLDAVAATVTEAEVIKIVVAMNLHPTGEEDAQETGIWAIPYSRINRERG
jgi:uncharacterized phage infection (PIP) family protein YhgE